MKTKSFFILIFFSTLFFYNTPSVYAFPISESFTNDARCDSIVDITLTEELGESHQIDELISASSATSSGNEPCVTQGSIPFDDYAVSITNLSPKYYVDLFFVSDSISDSIGNADGTIAGLDAFRIDSTGINDNLISESMTADEIFEPGETWTFVVMNFIVVTGGPHFFSEGLNSGDAGSTANIVANEYIPQTPVGSKSIPLESSSLLLANTQSFSWMIPVVLSVLGIGLFVIRRNNSDQKR